MSRLREFLYGPGEESIDMGQIDTLDLLAQQASWRMSDLAEALRIDPSTATRAVQRLVDAGFADRHSSADDGRVVQVRITPAGQSRVDIVGRRRSELFTHLMAAYDPDELPVFAEMLERFVGAIDSFVVALDATE